MLRVSAPFEYSATLAHTCERAGFFSEESFRRHFRRLAGVSPSDYRRALRQRAQLTAVRQQLPRQE
ncbi:helix-turn-helix domain-containing protein [Oxalobacteraceae bacterium]|nr:helix-turn-helix domain-containing protein [Oxalobacteraceae bacterium]